MPVVSGPGELVSDSQALRVSKRNRAEWPLRLSIMPSSLTRNPGDRVTKNAVAVGVFCDFAGRAHACAGFGASLLLGPNVFEAALHFWTPRRPHDCEPRVRTRAARSTQPLTVEWPRPTHVVVTSGGDRIFAEWTRGFPVARRAPVGVSRTATSGAGPNPKKPTRPILSLRRCAPRSS